MPAAKNVVPGKWGRIQVLFDNGWYSIISGTYEGETAIGERYNGESEELGYPNSSGHPVWYVVPHFLRIPVLQGALAELRFHPYAGSDIHQKTLVNALCEELEDL